MYTQVLILLLKRFILFRNFMGDATRHKPFGLVLTAVNEVFSCIVFILDKIIVLFY